MIVVALDLEAGPAQLLRKLMTQISICEKDDLMRLVHTRARP